LAKQLGADAAVSAQTLAALEKALRDSNLLRRSSDGNLQLSPAAIRRLGRSLLKDLGQVTDRQGQRDTRRAGALGELTGATRPWQFGDLEPWDVTKTMTNTITRMAGAAQDPASGLDVLIEDVELQETEARTRAAVALLVDTSFSMAAEG